MYSQSSISNRRSSRPAPTEETLFGLTCVICGTDYRTAPTVDALVVSHSGDGPTMACRGVCARMASGSATGLDEAPLSLAERVRRYEAGRARKQAGQARDEQPGSDA
ncbi:hypothetical protein [Streptomyces kanamyceticus]|uniref:Uncharacterized protein n=1 Tax=Streptomyces kanamyceticus TaxID=1967 RepID=A0A5J6GKQ4_STRKN|nr:hypothetical protein [Streptomyces kanamyceticus]QEU96039.1 hypothetical protein CP970_38495 [Streptomyces kanamyceticus]